MSSDSSDPDHPISKFIGNAFLVAVPLLLVTLLGYVGFRFVNSVASHKEVEAKLAAKSAPPAAAAPAPAASAPATTAPAAAPAPTSNTATAPAPAAPAAGGAVDPAVMATGKAAFATCAACHGPDGSGLKVGPALMAPSLIGSKIVLEDPDAPMLVVLKGIAKENMDFMGVMAPLASALDDEKLAAVMTYIRNEWGNSASPVSVEQAAAARKKFADVDVPAGVKRAEIEDIVAKHK